MARLCVLSIMILAILFMGACAQQETDEPAEAAVDQPDPDPTVADAAHYKVEFGNERVRIVRIRYGPGEASVMHYHPDSVAVYLTDNRVQMTAPDGSTEEIPARAGGHDFAPAGSHLPKNIGGEPLELVLVELWPARLAGTGGGEESGPDPTAVDSDHYKAEFENERVRIVRINYGPGEESVMHYHPDSVAVFLTDHHVQMTLPDGSTEEIHKTAGEHIYIPGGSHLPKNIGDEPWELVLVELK